MKIKKVALLGAGAVGAYFIWGLSEKMGDNRILIQSVIQKLIFLQEKWFAWEKRWELRFHIVSIHII